MSRYPLREAARTSGLEPDRASKVKPYDFGHSVATDLTERSGDRLGVGYLLGQRHATTTNHYVHARRRAAEAVLWGRHPGQIDGEREGHWNSASAHPAQSPRCEGQDSNLHAPRTLEPKRTQGTALSAVAIHSFTIVSNCSVVIPAWVVMMISTADFCPPARAAFTSPLSNEAKGS